ncbi:MAG: hypothetical protein ACK551_07255 [Vampirovibrionales bacterium]
MMNAQNNNASPNTTQKVRRWYDTDPVLLEVLNFMELAPKQAEAYAKNLIAGVEKYAPSKALEEVYASFEDPNRPQNRWYDENPTLSKAIELLKMMPPETQRLAAMQFIEATKSDPITYAILKESFAVSELDLSYLDEDYDDATLYVPYQASLEEDNPTKETANQSNPQGEEAGTNNAIKKAKEANDLGKS